VAVAALNLTEPKLASGNGEQLLADWPQADGASAIHSALEVSGLLMVSVLVTD